MKRTHLTFTLAIAAALAAAIGCQTTPQQQPAAQAPATPVQSPVERGKYLVQAMGCNDCHTTMKGMGPEGPIYDETMYLAGHPAGMHLPPPPPPGPWFASTTLTAWSGPWGISYTANITPDSLTGIGIWTEDVFIQTMRTGRHMGVARPILPPMPWQSIGGLNDEDIKAVYAYLRTIPPVSNQVPEPVIAPPPPAGGESH